MTYRLLALDLDETLLGEDLQISPRNLQAIREAVRRGVMVIVATGRMYCTSQNYAVEMTPGRDMPIISYHGALVKTSRTGRVLRHRPLDHSVAVAITREMEERGFHLNLYAGDRLYVREENRHTRYYQTIAGIELEPVGPLDDFLEETGARPTKLTIIDADGRLDWAEHFIRDRYGEQVMALQSRTLFLEITDLRSTKGQALAFVAGREGIRREEIIACGDSYNDLDMIKYAGLGVAMANARPSVRDAADLVTASNVEDGVARVIEEYILGTGS